MAQTDKQRRNKWIWILGGIAVLLLIISVISNRNKPKGEKVAVEKVTKRTIMETVSASGRIFPEKEIKISSDVSGEIVEMYVKEGDSVRAGQLLCKVNAQIYQDQVTRGEAGVRASKAQYANALSNVESVRARQLQILAQKEQVEAQMVSTRQSFKRNDQLHRDGIVSDAEFETTQSQLRQQEANLKAIEAQVNAALADLASSEKSAEASSFNLKSSEASLKELRTNLNKTSIYAPADGIVSKLTVEKGERVVGTAQMSGTEIMRIANLNAMEVQVDVSENDVLRLAVGNEVDIDVDAFPGRKFKGRVSEIANTASNAFTATGAANLTTDQVTNFVVKIRLDPASYADLIQGGRAPFRPGMSASVDIRTNTVTDVLSVPIQSVTTRDPALEGDKTDKTDKTAPEGSKEPNKTATKLKVLVFVVVNDVAKMVEVTTGIQDNKYIQIVSGLKGDEEVVSAPYNLIARKLKDGTTVVKVSEKELYATKKED